MIHRAQHLIALRRPQDALTELDQDFDSESPYHWWLRALALFGASRVDDALNAAASGLRIDPEYALLLDVVARCHVTRGDLVKAEEAVLAALREDAEDADLLALYARIVAQAGQLEKARKLIAQARRIDPENVTALRVEAALAVARGDDREALLRSREMLALDPEDAHAHRLTGEVLHGRGDVHAAADFLRAAVVNDPRDPGAADVARENLAWRHALMWPLRPLHKFGAAKVWIAGIALLLLARSTGSSRVTLAAGVLWISYCIYSWVVPAIVRRLVR